LRNIIIIISRKLRIFISFMPVKFTTYLGSWKQTRQSANVYSNAIHYKHWQPAYSASNIAGLAAPPMKNQKYHQVCELMNESAVYLLMPVLIVHMCVGINNILGRYVDIYGMTDLSLAAALGVTKFVTIIVVTLVTLCCVPLVRLRCSTNQLQGLIC
jgi:succinate dehydrogenase hydrophobic anchor subunit